MGGRSGPQGTCSHLLQLRSTSRYNGLKPLAWPLSGGLGFEYAGPTYLGFDSAFLPRADCPLICDYTVIKRLRDGTSNRTRSVFFDILFRRSEEEDVSAKKIEKTSGRNSKLVKLDHRDEDQ
ncbi:unnamed protein product [Leuciscus chuanchicus]